MLILTIETSCDETSVAIGEISARGGSLPRLPAGADGRNDRVKLLSHVISSQVKLHAKWGGVVPNLAAREHLKNLVPVLNLATKQAGFKKSEELAEKVDLIGVTQGPGLIPALLMGVNFAKALAYAWRKPLIPVNHMEAHLYTSWVKAVPKTFSFRDNPFPMLALLVSGGHTMLVRVEKHLKYKVLGETLDDAVGEAFDKVARILGLGYPGGPEISKLATRLRSEASSSTEVMVARRQSLRRRSADKPARRRTPNFEFTLPLRNSRELNFSFSGLKTAVLYKALEIAKNKKLKDILKRSPKPDLDIPLTEEQKADLARAFEDVAVESLIEQTKKALTKYPSKTVVLGGGVAANRLLRERFAKEIPKEFPKTRALLPPLELTGDNAAMLIPVTYLKWQKASRAKKDQFRNNWKTLEADSSLDLKN